MLPKLFCCIAAQLAKYDWKMLFRKKITYFWTLWRTHCL